MEYKTVICIDTSGSTAGNSSYFKRIKSILESINDKVLITWNSTAEISTNTSYMFVSTGGTSPKTFLNIIKNFDYNYNLIVTTDGQIFDGEVKACKEILNSCDILKRINSFKIYFIGHPDSMNLKISSLFNEVEEKEIIINDGAPINVVTNIHLGDLTYEDFQNENSLIASVLSLVQLYPQKRQEFRSQICQTSNRITAKLAITASIVDFYDRDDIQGCVEYVKNINTDAKKQLQKTVNKILQILDGDDDYSLSHLANTTECKEQEIEAETPEDDDNDEDCNDDFICNILYIKCSLPCILIKLIEDTDSENIDKYSLIPDKLSKKISENPFLILEHDDIIKKIIKRVDHQIIDLQAYNNLEDKSINPFTREDVKGAFIFHNDNVDYNLIFRNNNRALSFIFGENNKLPGNKTVWNVLFLYILVKHHIVWKQHESKLKEEIEYMFKNLKTFVTLTPLLNPTIIENLEASLWYTCLVSPIAFPNSSGNVLRFMESSEKIIELYSYITGKNLNDIYNKIKIWNLWKYLVRNRDDRCLKLEVRSKIQNHEVINGSIVLFSGKSKCNIKNDSNKCQCKKFEVEGNVVVRLYNILKKKSQPRLYGNIDFDIIYKDDVIMYETIEYDVTYESLIEHVFICLTTCQPTVICPVTLKHWKECVGEYDVKRGSYLRVFKVFCFKKNRYPKDEEELLEFHSNRINNLTEDLIVYRLHERKFFKFVLEKFADVMKEYSVEEYLRISNANSNETIRLVLEKNCKKCSIHEKFPA